MVVDGLTLADMAASEKANCDKATAIANKAGFKVLDGFIEDGPISGGRFKSVAGARRSLNAFVKNAELSGEVVIGFIQVDKVSKPSEGIAIIWTNIEPA